VLAVTSQQLFSLTRHVDDYSQHQQLSANLYQFKASVLSLSRADPLQPETAKHLQQVKQQVQQLGGRLPPPCQRPKPSRFRSKAMHCGSNTPAIWKAH
jgi:methyl-accepting chemotaxis protein